MKRIVLIAAAALVLIAGVAAGGIFYFKSQPVGSEAAPLARPERITTAYSDRSDAETQATKHTLRLVEDLAGVQDRIIQGHRAGLVEQDRLLAEIANTVRRFGQHDWEDYVNVRASFVYVLSGGDPEVLRSLVDGTTFNEADQTLARGIMSFAKGQTKVARKIFQDIDPRSLDVSLVGPFSLARASLYLDKDDAKAIALLDDARLSSPHTAIEEAAARREIPILMNTGDTPRALMLAADYVRRFGKSIYAWKLFGDFAAAAAKRDELNDAAAIARLVASIDGTDPRVTSDLLVAMAGEALLRGKLILAKTAAGEVVRMGKASDENLEKARLYEAAAEAPSGRAVDALKTLDQIPAGSLSDEDTEIRDAAGFVARAVAGAEMDNVSGGAGSAGHENASPIANKTSPEVSRVASELGKADAALKEADLIISGNTK